jgi:2-oxo-hept-3-ene-1,7-dioate hydratase
MVLFPVLADAACPDDAAVAAFVADYQAGRMSKAFAMVESLADGECSRAKVIRELSRTEGPIVGYKVAVTSPAQVKATGLPGPVWGAMFGKGMMQSGVKVPKIGAALRYEGDFLIVAKDAGLADAKTPLEALQHVAAVIPFIELVDLMVEQSTGFRVLAANMVPRAGVMGARVPVEATQAFLDRLINMDVVMTEDRSGKELGRVKGKDVLDGDPISAALWLAKQLKKDGVTLKPGDVLSLGSYHSPAPIKPGTTMTVKYLGLPGDPSVTAHFD